MVYIYNTQLNNNKLLTVALSEIYGIGSGGSSKICDMIGASNQIRLSQLTNSQIEELKKLLDQKNYIGSVGKQVQRQNIQRLINIASYRGFRHTEGLPCRGQRTHGNAKTVRKKNMYK